VRLSERAVPVAGSFRDPSGFVYVRGRSVYRQVNHSYHEDFDHLMNSGLYDALRRDELLIPHDEVENSAALTEGAYKVIQPERITFPSYPYEWCFSQIKDAALLTLRIQSLALEFDMSLKDASAYNVEYRLGRPIFIDTLSFEKYVQGKPWVAYRQFCQHFLAPLALIGYVDVRLRRLVRVFLDGIPLDLTSKLLPARTWANFGLLSHIHLQAAVQRRLTRPPASTQRMALGRTASFGLADNLRASVEKITWRPGSSNWANYYAFSDYSPTSVEDKRRVVAEFLDRITPTPVTAWDLGANNGLFSRVASVRHINTVAFDADPVVVEHNYLKARGDHETELLPLVLDLANPSPRIGWANEERMSIVDRGPVDVVLVLALIHHLAISNNLPFGKIAAFLAKVCVWAIIEFIPRSDPRVQQLLSNRADIFRDYDEGQFENEFGKFFAIRARSGITGTERTLYLMKKTGS
jgi:hypothetical protein